MKLMQEKRVALVVGGAQGIGFAAARLLAVEGCSLAIIDLNGDRAAEAASRLADDGAETMSIPADITRLEDMESAVEQATNRFGSADILINTAAIVHDKLFLDSTPDDWEVMLRVCLYGPMNCLKAVLPGMSDRGFGRVVFLASDSARLGQARLSYYAAAKAGTIALVKSVAQEVGSNGITLNVVSPGATDTELRQARERSMRAQMGEEKYARRVKTVLRMYPTGRIGLPEDAGAMVAFLASDHASWITGQVVSVNGGFAMP